MELIASPAEAPYWLKTMVRSYTLLERVVSRSIKRSMALSFVLGATVLSAIPCFCELVYSIRDLRLF